MQKSLTANIFQVLSANFIITMVGFVGSFVFPKILTINAYAIYQTYLLYIGYITILHLGFPSGMVINYAGRDYADINKKQYKAEVILLYIILTFFSSCFGIVFIVTKNILAFYMLLSVFPVCWVGSYKALTQAWSRFGMYAKLNIIGTVAPQILAIIYYVVTKDLPGKVYIAFYLLINWLLAISLLFKTHKDLKGIKRERILTENNMKTEKIGIALSFGNYVNTLFGTVDKQFINLFFGTTEFAFYSFGMSMQAIMTVFITSISQPLFPVMAQGRFTDDDFKHTKNLLLFFGSFSGCAYFIVSFIVKHFITKYVGSLSVVSIYFVVFPAMAVINCLYINLYKIKGMMKTYIKTLIGILVLAIILNSLAVHLIKNYAGVAIATTITYYFWLFLGSKQFECVHISKKDVMFIGVYIIFYFTTTRFLTEVFGCIVFFVSICIIAVLYYRESIKYYLEKIRFRKGQAN